MRYIRDGQVLLVMMLGISLAAWGQGGGRAGRAAGAQQAGAPQTAAPQVPAQQAPAPQAGAAGRGGRGGGGAGPSTSQFYDYDPAAVVALSIPDAPPTETHQKITVNGEALAYTARVGYLPLRNATTGQSEAHLFYTWYAKDGVTDSSGAPSAVFPGRRAGRRRQLAGVRRLGPEAHEVDQRRRRRAASLCVGRTIPIRCSARRTWSS